MYQKVIRADIGLTPVRVACNYIPKGRNFMAEEEKAAKVPENKRGFHVNKILTRTFFVARNNNFTSDVSDAKSFISCYLTAEVNNAIKDQKVNFYFNENNNTFYIENEKFMKVNNRDYGFRVLQDALHLIYKERKNRISYPVYHNNKKGDSICTVTVKAVFTD